MDFSTGLKDAVVELVVDEVREFVDAHPHMTAVDLEVELREGMQRLGAACLQGILNAQEKRYPEEKEPCSCGGQARYQFRRWAKTLTVFGWVDYRRAYYLCPRCHRGQYPLDQRLGLRAGQVSVALASLLALVGIETAFEQASQKIEKLLLIKVSENTVRKETQRFGELQKEEEEQWKVKSQDSYHLQVRSRSITDAPQRLYGSLDGVKIPVDQEWRELKCGCWYEVETREKGQGTEVGDTKALRAKAITYYCDIAEAQTFRDLVWATGYQRLADVAPEIVFVADGAAWIWKLVGYHFPHAVQIVDWYHASEYLTAIAHAAFGEGAPASKRWIEAARRQLWEGQIQGVIAICRLLEEHARAGPFARKAITYYTNNAKRMDYARLRKEGYQIGSGNVESACKQIGTQRLKRSGARWTENGARNTAKARAVWLSGQWERLEDRHLRLAQAA